ncbi:MAG: hypothetical protein BWX68_03036 [Verrucomicrobia bacterium ADurb.Bin063]|nr:MAG: hypothetical protein BWX68_03036 [Verrucomicrobia bacterium ADurb.Bin063]
MIAVAAEVGGGEQEIIFAQFFQFAEMLYHRADGRQRGLERLHPVGVVLDPHAVKLDLQPGALPVFRLRRLAERFLRLREKIQPLLQVAVICLGTGEFAQDARQRQPVR